MAAEAVLRALLAAESILETLLYANLVASAAILFVLVARGPVRALFGARAAYALWLIPLIAAAATLLPAMVIEGRPVVGPMPVGIERAVPVGAEILVDTPSPHWNSKPPVHFVAGLLVLIWLTGAAIALLRLLLKHVNAVRSLGKMTADAEGILRTENPLAGPAVVGVFRQRIVLPADFEARYDEAEQAAVLAHEKAHLAGRHVAAKALAHVLVCLNWFNPFVHIAAGQMGQDQELACDEAVVAAEPERRKSYARALLKTQTACVLPLGCHWPAGSAKLLKQRIGLVCGGVQSRALRRAGVVVVGVMAATGAAAAWGMQEPTLVDYQDTRAEVVTLSGDFTPAAAAPLTRDAAAVEAAKPVGLTRHVVAAGGTATEAAQAMRIAYSKIGWKTDMLPKPGTERYASFEDGEFGIAGTAQDGRTVIVNDSTFDEYPGAPHMTAAETVEVLRSGQPKGGWIVARAPVPEAVRRPWRGVASQMGGQSVRIGFPRQVTSLLPAMAEQAVELPSQEARLAAFASNDLNRDGKLTRDEYRGVLKTLNFEDQFNANWPRRDTNNDDFITADEYREPLS